MDETTPTATPAEALIQIIRLEDNVKNGTKRGVWRIASTINRKPIGLVKWFDRFDKYCYFPRDKAKLLFDPEMLEELAHKLRAINDKYGGA